MTIWIRIYSLVESDGAEDGALTVTVKSKLYIWVHRCEQSARAAAAEFGGVVLEVEAASLKGQIEFDDITLTESDDGGGNNDDERKADSNAYVTVVCTDVPHKIVFQSLEDGKYSDTPPVGERHQEIMDFTDEGGVFLESLAEEMGVGGFTQ
jgi:hypothetical protein